MGAVYSVDLKIKAKDNFGLSKAMKEFVVNNIKDHTAEFRNSGLDWENNEDIIRYMLAGNGYWKNGFRKKTVSGFQLFSNDFDATYSWEYMLINFFEAIGPYLENGSEIYIEPDDDHETATIKNGKIVWSN